MIELLSNNDVLAVVKLIAAVISGSVSIGAPIAFAILRVDGRLQRRLDTMGEQSEARNRRLHQRIDDLVAHSDSTFVRKDVHDADVRGIMHAVEEYKTVALAHRGAVKEALHG